uniref:Ig-like domain-containing protein n=1 Tax=Malurus cyaneus samueli TaxID=2593467 RepID=A0A8C5X333_9PASS
MALRPPSITILRTPAEPPRPGERSSGHGRVKGGEAAVGVSSCASFQQTKGASSSLSQGFWVLMRWGGGVFPLTGGRGLCLWGTGDPCSPPAFTHPPAAGQNVTVSCEASSELPELTLLYWLEDGSFVESLHPDGAVREGTLQGSGVTLHRDLHFSSFDTQHLRSNFTCVVLSPLGVDTREVRWPCPAPTLVTGQSGRLR